MEINGSGTEAGEPLWEGGPSDAMSYASALYYTLSCMTSVGFGNISPTSESEKIFTICLMILGCKKDLSVFYNTINDTNKSFMLLRAFRYVTI